MSGVRFPASSVVALMSAVCFHASVGSSPGVAGSASGSGVFLSRCEGAMACFLVFGDSHHGAHSHFHFVKFCYIYHIVSFKSVVSAASTNRVLRGSDAPQKTAMFICRPLSV